MLVIYILAKWIDRSLREYSSEQDFLLDDQFVYVKNTIGLSKENQSIRDLIRKGTGDLSIETNELIEKKGKTAAYSLVFSAEKLQITPDFLEELLHEQSTFWKRANQKFRLSGGAADYPFSQAQWEDLKNRRHL